MRSCAPGSSPLARGLRSEGSLRQRPPGIIPARAGFTTSGSRRTPGVTDHPRSRGVYTPPASSTTTSTGSSPLARGLHSTSTATGPSRRIIPARAGFTDLRRALDHLTADHPRSRGVYVATCPRRRNTAGSSPLARGLPPPRTSGGAHPRIIPARAGFTGSVGRRPGRGWDHPRSRGVYPLQPPDDAHGPGSSPLARGLRRAHPPDALPPGIIPARAGFTATGPPGRCSTGDHPRSRGVYTLMGLHDATLTGSSPLARGLPAQGGDLIGPSRIIPARAGFTPTSPSSSPSRPDHPRSRGVYVHAQPGRVGRLGSSPLARGLR